MYITAGMI